ncbi:hypothetical protein [Mucilaginibacter sp. OK098]|uniref:hypothetical protein n=1 Tax=Mucilaginibacter sp. OK098 TaxID=1855297 RepID=UPI00092283DA|nr:hypothetical protein [Mucilaginibacter sp. OK098]SHN02284.1 hypothetical protein SAMN05216524_104624 [Mucilaginibacter sp. OK098]
MTFDEFFKKKRVDLVALEKAEPALFSEFKTHYEQMGEKSFDHTKKYWFNKTRRQFPLAVEVKTEKPHIANPLAEQTITESLSEASPVSSAPKTGFVPRFRAASTPPPPEDKKEELPTAEPTSPPPKIGFTPKFRASAPPKPVTEDKKDELPAASEPVTPPTENIAAKPAGFVPRFKMKPKAEAEESIPPANDTPPQAPENTEAKPAYKPRFVPPKPKE